MRISVMAAMPLLGIRAEIKEAKARHLHIFCLPKRLRLLALVFFSALAGADSDTQSRVAEQAAGYAHSLAREAGADYTPSERAVLRDAAQTLVGRMAQP